MSNSKPAARRALEEQVLMLDLRCEMYHASVARRLLAILKAQDTNGSTQSRRSAVEREITALADVVIRGGEKS